MRKPIFGDDEEEDQVPVKEYLTEYSSKPQEEIQDSEPLVIARLENSFANGRLRVQQSDADVKIKAEDTLDSNDDVSSTHHVMQRLLASSRPAHGGRNAASEPLTAEERAMQELIDPTEIKTEHKIERLGGNELFDKATEHPDMSTLEDYEAIPVEAFGLAMLRGMGYEPPKTEVKTKSEEKLRRPDFLGLGATARPEDSKSAKELAMKKFEKRKQDRNYVPVVKINKRTGQIVKEDETEKPTVTKYHNADHLSMTEVKSRTSSRRSRSRTPEQRSRHESSSRHDKYDSRHKSSRSHSSRYDDGRRDRRRERSRSPRRDSDRDRYGKSKTHRDQYI